MSLNLNKVMLAGRLTADPELKTTLNGLSVTSFTIAVDQRGAKNEEKKTDFIDCTAWRERAEFITKYFRKGTPIYVEGHLNKRVWEDKQGGKRSAVDVIVDEVEFVTSKDADARPRQTAFAPATASDDNGDMPF